MRLIFRRFHIYVNFTAGWQFCTKLMQSRSWLWLLDVAPISSSMYVLYISGTGFCTAGADFVQSAPWSRYATHLWEKLTSERNRVLVQNKFSKASQSIGGRKFVRLLGKCCSASSPSECGMHVYKDVISMVNKYFSWEFGFWLIPSIRLMAWVLSFMYVCSDCTSKCRTTSQ